MLKTKKISQILPNLIIFTVVFAIVLCCSDVAFADDSVIIKVRQRAIEVIEHYKPIVYILGGFGLICVAWGAIFGKMNWKWFGSLAIGLFLVAWMGHLIDYFTRDRSYQGAGPASEAFHTTHIRDVSKFGDTLDKRSEAESGRFISLVIKGKNGANEVDSGGFHDYDYAENSIGGMRSGLIDADLLEDTLTMPDLPPDNQVDPGSIAQDEDDSEDGE